MNDHDVIRALRAQVGVDFDARFSGDACITLSLYDDRNPFGGLIRHHSHAEKQNILTLVARLENLEYLNLRKNKLGELPHCLGGVAALTTSKSG